MEFLRQPLIIYRMYLLSKNNLNINYLLLLFLLFSLSCNQKPEEPSPEQIGLDKISVDGVSSGLKYEKINLNPVIELKFNLPVSQISALENIKMSDKNSNIPIQINFADDDRTITILPEKLQQWQEYSINIAATLTAKNGSTLGSAVTISLATSLDMSDKFPQISEEELLTLVQRQTFKYFWDFGHTVSGMARERSSSGDIVTTGGTGFGIMAMIVAVERGFISRTQAVERIQTIVSFLDTRCTKYHGAFSHWINGQTGATQPFSAKDNGADLVETSFLMQGLLTALQYFSKDTPAETKLRNDINILWEAVEWDWFRHDEQNMLYWHWSPDYSWEMNMPIRGWNECLITHILAASSPTHPIPKTVYDEGWAENGGIKNGKNFYGYTLPLGIDYGGPLFFSHYSFLGLNPTQLKDVYADYWEQNKNHTLINYQYCINNPLKYDEYGADCWGLTASDGNQGYSAYSPTNDQGVIAPTAAISSMPYTPKESMQALKFFYYKLGDQIWKEYGFIDAFNLSARWYDNEFLAIDQGTIIVMIENYRTQLIWNLFMQNDEIKLGLTKLGFTY
jgi:hypothetical protein